MADAAVIFDVDGVLLELTRAEENAFFAPFEKRYALTNISRDWNSYEIRNDENIVAEILARNNLPSGDISDVIADYVAVIEDRLGNGTIKTVTIPGADELLQKLRGNFKIGIATANFLIAAKLRLQRQNLWNAVSAHAFGAEGGGHKRQTVARAIASVGLPKSRIVYVGDNLNDVDAGLSNGVHFIGFSNDPKRLEELRQAGTVHTSNNHVETLRLIGHLLGKG
jgi:HAD superfamily hydrolase (TIGR01549 family)